MQAAEAGVGEIGTSVAAPVLAPAAAFAAGDIGTGSGTALLVVVVAVAETRDALAVAARGSAQ